ncbi:MAG: antitoxin family protein [Gemmataceae bacterium]|nr:antitoxin family protein [Gemmataceae bacterium]
MSQPFEAVYQDGVFRPTGPVDVPPGATVRLAVVPAPSPGDLNGPTMYDLFKDIIDMPIDPGRTGYADAVSENVDRILYGGPKGAL